MDVKEEVVSGTKGHTCIWTHSTSVSGDLGGSSCREREVEWKQRQRVKLHKEQRLGRVNRKRCDPVPECQVEA